VIPAEANLNVYGPAVRLKLDVGRTRILADGRGGSTIAVSALDSLGQPAPLPDRAVDLSVAGEGVLDCGASMCRVALSNGQASARLTSTLRPGHVAIRAAAAGLAAAESAVESLPGSIQLQASPPERVNLPDGGTWLKYRTTIYATIRAGGERVKDADNLVRLHVTGSSAKMPPDLEVRAVNGVAVFKDVSFDPPPKYVFHVTSEGLMPAQIPIY
jgi:hypothetical protein